MYFHCQINTIESPKVKHFVVQIIHTNFCLKPELVYVLYVLDVSKIKILKQKTFSILNITISNYIFRNV